MYTSGSCTTGLRTFYPGSRLLYVLDLGEAAPLGGTLTLTTCGHTANNTVIYVGTGCPTWALPFGCLAGNDNAGDGGAGVTVTATCASNPRASSLTIPGVASRTLHVQLGGYGGAPVVSGLGWNYAPAPASRSASASRSRTRSRTRSASGTRTRSRTRSATRSRSRTRKAK